MSEPNNVRKQILNLLNPQIEKHGWACYTGNNFTYTVGLTTYIGYELLLNVPSVLSPEFRHEIVTHFVNELRDNPDNIKLPKMNNLAGMRLRFELTEADLFAYVDDYGNVSKEVADVSLFPVLIFDYLATIKPRPVTFVQILVGDKNNLLPGEAGYDDENWPQFRYKELRKLELTL